MTDTDLSDAGLSGAHLEGADLNDAGLRGADLSDANLRNAGLSDVDLSGADLSGANLSGADLGDADLSDAELRGAKGITQEHLEVQAKPLEGAIMPDGQKIPSESEPVEWGEPIPAGEYVVHALEPTFRLEVGKGWVALKRDKLPMLVENPQTNTGLIIFTSPRHVFDPSNLSEPKEAPVPDNADEWASWFQRHPNLETSNTAPVSIGGASGMRIDVTPSPKLDNYPQDFCDSKPCVPLYSAITSSVNWKDRFATVDIGGMTVVIDVSAPASKFEEFLPKAQKVLDTLEWKGT